MSEVLGFPRAVLESRRRPNDMLSAGKGVIALALFDIR
jgi:hypothetical protein